MTDTKRPGMTKTHKMVMSAVLSALSVAGIYISSFTPLDLTVIALTSVCIFFAVIELGGRYALLIYAVTGILVTFLLPDKSTALIYVMVVGWYPMAKVVFERYHYVVAWALKLSAFNTALLAAIVVTVYILHIPDDDTLALKIATILLANVTFVMCDLLATKLIQLYMVKVRPRLGFKTISRIENAQYFSL